MAHYNFVRDLAVGKETEKEAAKLLEKHFEFDSLEFNNDNKYDIKTISGEDSKTFEVKTDLMCGRTGNFAIEYECRGKPSGIVTTEADYWIYKLDDGFYMTTVEVFKGIIEEEKYFRMVTGGDRGSNTKMFLFKLPMIKELMQKL